MRRWIVPLIVIIVVVGFVSAVIVAENNRYNAARREGELFSRLQAYCIEYRIRHSLPDDSNVCLRPAWASGHSEQIDACDRLSPVLKEPFHECLEREGILPIG